MDISAIAIAIPVALLSYTIIFFFHIKKLQLNGVNEKLLTKQKNPGQTKSCFITALLTRHLIIDQALNISD